MQKHPRYPIHKAWHQVFDLMGVPTARILKRAGLPADFIELESRGMSSQQFFAIWEAIGQETTPHNLPMEMAKILANGPFVPAVYAFSCSPNIATGLERLSVFKPLVAPIRLIVTHSETRVRLEIDVAEPHMVMPECMVAFELVYFLELCRVFTGVDILPVEVGMPYPVADQPAYDRFFGRAAQKSDRPSLTLRREDAYRPLISENPQLWAGFERELTQQLAEHRRNTPMSMRVRTALMELLPAGQSSVDAVSDRLVTSRRSLQRHLRLEGETFQKVLDATRSELSMHYLQKGELSVEEISYLLAYRDPNSFYRAFHSWTGSTPSRMRLAPA